MTEESIREGGCGCGQVRYRLTVEPMIVHCCHCSWCQRETGSAFVVNALVESDSVELTAGEPEMVTRPSTSGKGQPTAFCPTCRVALWSHYADAGPSVRFLRAGTLDDAASIAPDIHIFTSTKLPWVVIPEDAAAVPEFYRFSEVWSPESLARFKAAIKSTG